MGRHRRRGTGIIDRLPEALRDTVNQMLLAGITYREIVEYLSTQQVPLSQMAVHRYANRYLATVEELRMSQENMKFIMEEIDKYPGLDATEAILRVAGQNIFTALTSVSEEKWNDINPEKLVKSASGLIRAAGYKRRVDLQNKSDTEAALDASQQLMFDVLAKNHPALYDQVQKALRQEKARMSEHG